MNLYCKNRGIFHVILAGILLFPACGKYEEGPDFSLRSARSRITGTWKIDRAEVNGIDNTQEVMELRGEDYVWKINGDGTFSETGKITDDGTWKFADNKRRLDCQSSFRYPGKYSFKILRLKNKELWLQEVDGKGDLRSIYLEQ